MGIQGDFALDERLAEQDARFDGVWVLRTNKENDAYTVIV